MKTHARKAMQMMPQISTNKNMNKIQQQASIAFLEGMAEEIRNFDLGSSDPVEFIKHLKEMAKIISEESSGSHLYDDPEDDIEDLPFMPDDYMDPEDALELLVKAHKSLSAGGWKAFMFAAATARLDGGLPIPIHSTLSMEDDPVCQNDVLFMMKLATQSNPALRNFLRQIGQTSSYHKRRHKSGKRHKQQSTKHHPNEKIRN